MLAGGVVDGGDVRDLLELALCVVTEEGENRDDGLGGDVEDELVLVDGELLDVLGQAGGDVLAVLVQGRDGARRVVGGVDTDGLLEGRGRGLVGGRWGGQHASDALSSNGQEAITEPKCYAGCRVNVPWARATEVRRPRATAIWAGRAARRPPRRAASEDRAAMVSEGGVWGGDGGGADLV